MSEVKSLWGNINVHPASDLDYIKLMREQADLLESQTDGLLLGKLSQSSNQGVYRYGFTIIAPKLKNYSYTLFSLLVGFYPYPVFWYDPISDWDNVDYLDRGPDTPLFISPTEFTNVMEPTHRIQEFEQFKEIFARFLQSDRTTEVIETLLAKSQSVLSLLKKEKSI